MEGTVDEKPDRMRCRGIRGATTVAANTREAILAGTRELLTLIAERNAIETEEITSIFFTVTDDLNAEHPALAARQLGWTDVALLCAREIPVPGSLGRCVRVLLHVNTTLAQTEIRHVYLHDAVVLRPGWAGGADGTSNGHADGLASEARESLIGGER
jgi:chorismate mutase